MYHNATYGIAFVICAFYIHYIYHFCFNVIFIMSFIRDVCVEGNVFAMYCFSETRFIFRFAILQNVFTYFEREFSLTFSFINFSWVVWTAAYKILLWIISFNFLPSEKILLRFFISVTKNRSTFRLDCFLLKNDHWNESLFCKVSISTLSTSIFALFLKNIIIFSPISSMIKII